MDILSNRRPRAGDLGLSTHILCELVSPTSFGEEILWGLTRTRDSLVWGYVLQANSSHVQQEAKQAVPTLHWSWASWWAVSSSLEWL